MHQYVTLIQNKRNKLKDIHNYKGKHIWKVTLIHIKLNYK